MVRGLGFGGLGFRGLGSLSLYLSLSHGYIGEYVWLRGMRHNNCESNGQ